MPGEKAWRELHQDASYCFQQAATYKTAAVRPLASYRTNHINKFEFKICGLLLFATLCCVAPTWKITRGSASISSLRSIMSPFVLVLVSFVVPMTPTAPSSSVLGYWTTLCVYIYISSFDDFLPWFSQLGLQNTLTSSLRRSKTPPNEDWPSQRALQNTPIASLPKGKTPQHVSWALD